MSNSLCIPQPGFEHSSTLVSPAKHSLLAQFAIALPTLVAELLLQLLFAQFAGLVSFWDRYHLVCVPQRGIPAFLSETRLPRSCIHYSSIREQWDDPSGSPMLDLNGRLVTVQL